MYDFIEEIKLIDRRCAEDLIFLGQKGFDDFVLSDVCNSLQFKEYAYYNIKKFLKDDIDVKNIIGKEKLMLLQQMFSNLRAQFLGAKIGRDGHEENPIDVTFDFRFGWTLKSVGGPAFLGKINTIRPEKITLGRLSYLSGASTIAGENPLKIGSFCSIAEGQYFFTHPSKHPMSHLSSYVFENSKRLIDIGFDMDDGIRHDKDNLKNTVIQNDVWIARNCTILSGVTIANGCVIGANSTVTKDTEPYGVYIGSPARLIRHRFSKHTIDALLKLSWWNWEIDKIKKNKELFNLNITNIAPEKIFEAVM